MGMTLKALRANKNWNQSEAAKNLGISVDVYKNWELGRSFPNVPQINRITSVYNVSYDDIIFLPEITL